MWMRFPEGKHIRWVPHVQGGESYELQILVWSFFTTMYANELDKSTEDHKMAAENISDAKGYATAARGVFVKHPAKNLWKM